MKNLSKKKPKEIEKEIKTKLIQTIEGILIKGETSSVKKLKKTIKNAASEIAKKYMKAIRKDEKKAVEESLPISKKRAGKIIKDARKSVRIAKTKKINGKKNHKIPSE